MQDLADTVRDAWARIETWCGRHFPPLLADLNPGASEEEIRELEAVVGQRLPDDVRVSLSIHNGEGEPQHGLIVGDELFSTVSIANLWNAWRDLVDMNEEMGSETTWPEESIAPDYANVGWIPLTQDAGSNHLGVDLAPGATGTVGQVINFGRDERHKCVLAANWAEFLADYATYLESGILGKIANPERTPWSDTVTRPFATHPHDGLREWRQQGNWPPRCGSVACPDDADVQRWLAWNNGAALAVARSIRRHGSTDEFPVLADALEDAGCDNRRLLELCRGDIFKVDAAWVLQVLLGEPGPIEKDA